MRFVIIVPATAAVSGSHPICLAGGFNVAVAKACCLPLWIAGPRVGRAQTSNQLELKKDGLIRFSALRGQLDAFAGMTSPRQSSRPAQDARPPWAAIGPEITAQPKLAV
jgi:hypothetical protein